ncbi:exodeoxyribonuclease VII large subunit [Lachnotalea glycerini]|uniref:Exodeoxyribonuclease 7 large subunit n=1 Tax=Lachnotalea glycerini TaxID=1763509 RepID=A0A255I406_9FIRM|nr:exodeoxyribonuclease VII large subunit [Lachnotalea glycerini]PXV93562.1 exodeoxyribonuclease VII large subunit [Lachnotalea glycerini]RDY32520.1 exodeoxyribonuclease VII large subunit [Lachnotalea glycerini]
MQNVYSVGQVNSYIKNMFTQDYALNKIYIKGEVSNCKYHTTGHIYFTLKDATGTLACVMFATARKGLAFQMKEGQRVIALGSVNVYERDGKYQLYAKEIILDGAGLLYQKFEDLKKELEEMGMFANEYKQPIKRFVSRIGIVTAPTGAAIRDIIHISLRRNPYVQLILYPALVQGESAPASIVKGIEVLDKAKVDVIIVGRGGGSIEDLWAFNEEIVARAIFDCNTPIISAVGHETDITIADYVADLRAPTPSAAAELAVYEYNALVEQLLYYKHNFDTAFKGIITDKRNQLDRMRLKLQLLSPSNQIREKRQISMDAENRLSLAMKQIISLKRHQLEIYMEKMSGLSPINKLNQGYAYVADDNGNTVNDIEKINQGDLLTIQISNGEIKTQVQETRKENRFIKQ